MMSIWQRALLLSRQLLRSTSVCHRACSSIPDPEANLPPAPESPIRKPQGPCPVNSYNEWDPLEEVIVGNAPGARYPKLGPDFSVSTYIISILFERGFVNNVSLNLVAYNICLIIAMKYIS